VRQGLLVFLVQNLDQEVIVRYSFSSTPPYNHYSRAGPERRLPPRFRTCPTACRENRSDASAMDI
jgi:hypothetical protein